MTAKKTFAASPRPMLAKPRKVVVNPTVSCDVILTDNLLTLEEVADNYMGDIIAKSDESDVFLLQAREGGGGDPLNSYGLYLGFASDGDMLPEIVINERGAYVLIFHNTSK